jgi:TM2 domain-containing membrane protein YozV
MYRKNMAIAYILWLIFGHFGIHRFYTGRAGTGIMQLLLALIGGATTWIFVGYLPLIILWIWLFIDIFLIPGMCRNPK